MKKIAEIKNQLTEWELNQFQLCNLLIREGRDWTCVFSGTYLECVDLHANEYGDYAYIDTDITANVIADQWENEVTGEGIIKMSNGELINYSITK